MKNNKVLMLMVYTFECRIESSLIRRKTDWSECKKETKLVALRVKKRK